MDTFGKFLIGTGAIVATVCLAPIAIGFGSTGVVGGSIAAGIQAGIGNVVAGSAFAFTQSFVMGGTATAIASVGAVTAGTGVAISCGNFFLNKYNP